MAQPKSAPPGSARSKVAQPKPGDEDRVLAELAADLERAAGHPPPNERWIGDDAAVVEPGPGPLLLAVDAVVEGVHADLALVSLEDLGWKALTVAVSDIGAMGGRPRHALVTLGAPPGRDLLAVNRGIAEASAAWGCPVVGGDLTTASEIVVSVAVTGSLDGEAPVVSRAGARPGDAVFVTGPLGRSAAGLRLLRAGQPPNELTEAHRRPVARLTEGQAARSAGARAMIDVSDGLAIDLDRLARASGVGIALDHIPTAPGATEEEAIGGGEDYELVMVTARPDDLLDAFGAAGLRRPDRIGTCTSAPGGLTVDGQPIEIVGWQHRFG